MDDRHDVQRPEAAQSLVLLATVATSGCAADSSPQSATPTVTLAPAPDRVLFVGSSFIEGKLSMLPPRLWRTSMTRPARSKAG